MFSSLGAAVVRFRWIVIGVWIVRHRGEPDRVACCLTRLASHAAAVSPATPHTKTSCSLSTATESSQR